MGEFLNKILLGDVIDELDKIPDNSVDLVVTSPPYFNQREYSQYDMREEYLGLMYNTIVRCKDKLKDGCAMVWNIGDERSFDLPSHTSVLFEQALMKYMDTIVWVKPGQLGARGAHIVRSRKYYPYFKHEHIFIYSKGDFNKRIDDDMLEYAREHNTNVWHMPTVRQNYDHPAMFDEELPKRAISFYTNKGDIVLDPFCGSGTSCAMAKRLGRNYIGIDRNEQYKRIAEQRINEEN